MAAFLIRWFVTTIAVYVATKLVPGFKCEPVGALLGASLLLGIINAVVRPVLLLLSLPFIIVTMGFFISVVNKSCSSEGYTRFVRISQFCKENFATHNLNNSCG